jgi:hypothetical protein
MGNVAQTRSHAPAFVNANLECPTVEDAEAPHMRAPALVCLTGTRAVKKEVTHYVDAPTLACAPSFNHTRRLSLYRAASYRDSRAIRSVPSAYVSDSRSCPFCVEVEVKLRPTLSRIVCLRVRLPSEPHDQIFVSLGYPIPVRYKYGDLALRFQGVSNEIVKYRRKLCGTWTPLLCQGPEAIVRVHYRPVLSSERAPHIKNSVIDRQKTKTGA